MGNQNSKGGTGTPKNASQTSLDRGSDNLQSYPSFSKADTKESTRSALRGLKSKIPGGGKTDSPRNSTSGLSGEVSRQAALSQESTAPGQDSTDDITSPDDLKPPPSPIQSASMRMGHHDVDGT
jgi:serine/threonine-protein phosphatase PP1 catalytic subunit